MSAKRALAEARTVGLTDPQLEKLAELYVQSELAAGLERPPTALDPSVQTEQ